MTVENTVILESTLFIDLGTSATGLLIAVAGPQMHMYHVKCMFKPASYVAVRITRFRWPLLVRYGNEGL